MHEYLFISSFIKSVEQFSKKISTDSPGELIYKDSDLRCAYERVLYFSYIENSEFFDYFVKWNKNEAHKVSFWSSDLTLLRLVKVLAGPKAVNSGVLILANLKQFLKRLILIPIKLILNIYYRYCRNLVKNNKHRYKTIFLIRQKKFVTYLQPIFKDMKKPFAILTRDQESVALARELSLPVINLYPSFNVDLNFFREAYLNDFFIIDLYESLTLYLKTYKPKEVVVVEGNAPEDEVINQVGQKLGISTVCIQHGWSPIVHNGFRNMTYSKMLVWGKGFADLLKPFNPKQKFIVTGNQAIELSTKNKPKKTIKKRVAFLLQEKSSLIDEDDNRKMCQLMQWLAKSFPGVDVIVREPARFTMSNYFTDNLKSFSNIKSMPYWENSLAEVLNISWITVSIYSSTILESIAKGVLPIVFNLTSMPKFYPDVDLMNAGIEVKNVKQAKIVIKKLLNSGKYEKKYYLGMKKFRKEFFSSKDAISSIVAEIEG